jgi:hypothetical protein
MATPFGTALPSSPQELVKPRENRETATQNNDGDFNGGARPDDGKPPREVLASGLSDGVVEAQNGDAAGTG